MKQKSQNPARQPWSWPHVGGRRSRKNAQHRRVRARGDENSLIAHRVKRHARIDHQNR